MRNCARGIAQQMVLNGGVAILMTGMRTVGYESDN